MKRSPPYQRAMSQRRSRGSIAADVAGRHYFNHHGCRDRGCEWIADQAIENRKGLEAVRRHGTGTARDQFLRRVERIHVHAQVLRHTSRNRGSRVGEIDVRIADV
jgi:hypothetical protein